MILTIMVKLYQLLYEWWMLYIVYVCVCVARIKLSD